MIIGITGGTGSGKTTLLNEIKKCGGTVIDCDAVYHELLQTDKDLLSAIENRFPGTVENGSLLRKKLGAIVFSDKKALQDLNAITHAAVKKAVLGLIPNPPTLVAIDAIGLFEGDLADLCNITVAVTAPQEDRVMRLVIRDGISEEYARKRIAAQHSDDWFREKCDYVLVNDEKLDAFATKCVAFLQDLGIINP